VVWWVYSICANIDMASAISASRAREQKGAFHFHALCTYAVLTAPHTTHKNSLCCLLATSNCYYYILLLEINKTQASTSKPTRI
jgi:hypothetical protein